MNPGKLLLNARVAIDLTRLMKRFPFDAREIRSLQLRKLRRLLIHAHRSFEFYRERMDRVGFQPENLRDVSELAVLPPVTKAEYRAFTEGLVQRHPERYARGYLDGTSGSTGMPLTIYRTWGERAYMLSKYLRSVFLNGYRLGDTTLSIVSPHRLTSRDSLLQKFGIMRRYSVSYTDTPDNMLANYQRVAPDFLYANKSQLVQLARAIQSRGVAIVRPRMYLCAAETLDDNSKRLIQSVFGRDNMFEIYGAVEFNTLAFRVKGSDFFHFSHDTDVLELENHGAIATRAGHCLITDLHTYSMPLIRYRLGDWMETSERDGLLVVDAIRGRLDDWITWRDGTRIPFHPFYEVMERRDEVTQFRVVQETVDLLRILLVLKKGTDANDVKAVVLRDLRQEIRHDVAYEVEFLDELPPEPSGKLRMVVSKVGPGDLPASPA